MIIVDRFEGDFAVLECDGGHVESVPRTLLPPGALEGDVLLLQADGTYAVDADTTAARAAHIRNLMDQLFDK